MKTGESGLTVFRLLTKENRWKWVQANARLVYKNGKPDYIIATQRPLLYVPLLKKCSNSSHLDCSDRIYKKNKHILLFTLVLLSIILKIGC